MIYDLSCTPEALRHAAERVRRRGTLGLDVSDGSNSPPQWMIDLCAYLEDERGYRAGISRVGGNWEDTP